MKTATEKAIDYCLEVEGQIHQPYIYAFLAGYKAANEWISVEDELPKDTNMGYSDKVLVKDYNGIIYLDQYNYDFRRFMNAYNVPLTHWKPIE